VRELVRLQQGQQLRFGQLGFVVHQEFVFCTSIAMSNKSNKHSRCGMRLVFHLQAIAACLPAGAVVHRNGCHFQCIPRNDKF
jgi:hypothetical protein